jgi:hypothetical protein
MSRKFSIDLDSDEDDECLVHSDDDQHHSDNEYQRILSDLTQQNTRSNSGEKKSKKKSRDDAVSHSPIISNAQECQPVPAEIFLASLGREPTQASDMVACFKCNLVFKTYFRKVYREIKIERTEEQCDN